MVTLICGDCQKEMIEIASKSIDLLFTDLPYGTTNCKWDTPIDLDLFWRESERIVKPTGCKAMFAQTPFDKVLGCSNLKELRYEWIWEKTQATGHLNSKKMPMKAHENILIFYNKLPTYNPQMTHGHKPIHSYTKYLETQNRSQLYGAVKKEMSGGGSTDRFPRDVIKGPSDKQRCHIHEAQKPVWLCEQIILTYTNQGDTVLDPCMGSGSIGVACIKNGRNYIGIEKDPEIFQKATARIDALQREMEV